jgi:hypothetical protein
LPTLLADQPVDQGRLAHIGPPDDGELEGAVLGLGRLALPRRDLRLMRFEEAAQRVIELAEPEAVLGRERQRLA